MKELSYILKQSSIRQTYFESETLNKIKSIVTKEYKKRMPDVSYQLRALMAQSPNYSEKILKKRMAKAGYCNIINPYLYNILKKAGYLPRLIISSKHPRPSARGAHVHVFLEHENIIVDGAFDTSGLKVWTPIDKEFNRYKSSTEMTPENWNEYDVFVPAFMTKEELEKLKINFRVKRYKELDKIFKKKGEFKKMHKI